MNSERIMVDLHFDMAAAILIMIIIISMLARKVVRGTTNRLFFLILNLSLIGSISDIFSETQAIHRIVRVTFDYVYFFVSVLIPLIYALYVYSSIGALRFLNSRKRNVIILTIPWAPL